jgi:hypothetical protein
METDAVNTSDRSRCGSGSCTSPSVSALFKSEQMNGVKLTTIGVLPKLRWLNRLCAGVTISFALTLMTAAMALCGCNSPGALKDVPDVTRSYTPHVQQVLDNIAAFTKDPGSWPSHVLVFRGELEVRHQFVGSIGTTTKAETTKYSQILWNLAALDDPYDIKRVRLLYQWQVGHITFDELDRRWNEIRDRPVLDGSGKPILGSDGRPKFLALQLPVSRETRRDWITDDSRKAVNDIAGRSGPMGMPGTTTVWVTDTEAASQFSLAILSAMANSRVKGTGWGDAAMLAP